MFGHTFMTDTKVPSHTTDLEYGLIDFFFEEKARLRLAARLRLEFGGLPPKGGPWPASHGRIYLMGNTETE